MAFTYVNPKALFSNKPHNPDPLPSAILFPMGKLLSDGRSIWVSVPQPDRLSFIVPISAEIYGKGIPDGTPVGVFAHKLYAYLASEPFGALRLAGSNWQPDKEPGGNKTWKFIILAMGGRDSSVRFDLMGSMKKGLSLRLEFNPRKLGKPGFQQLIMVLGGFFDLKGLIETARATRVDVCVDVVGVRMSELVLWHKDQGTRTLYVGSDGALETLYLHRKLPPPKPHGQNWPKPKKPANRTGTTMLRAYDRVRERLSAQKLPPFGPAPVTRLERHVRLVNCPLGTLPTMGDKLVGLRVGFIQSQLPKRLTVWLRYVAARRTMSETETCSLLGIQPSMASEFREAEKVPNSDLLNSSEIWSHWKVGLAETGLLAFLGAK